jgi:hypothetical protein
MIQRNNQNPEFFRSILWTDESLFTKDGAFNCHNDHVYDLQNPHFHVVKKSQHRFQLMVWAGIIGNQLFGPYFIEGGINGNIKIKLNKLDGKTKINHFQDKNTSIF